MISVATLSPSMALLSPQMRLYNSATTSATQISALILRKRVIAATAQANSSPSHASSWAQSLPDEPVWQLVVTTGAARLRALKPGWDGVGSVAISHAALFKAESIVLEALRNLSIATPPYLVPVGDGSVQIEWHEKTAELELLIEPEGQMSIWIQSHLSGQELEAEGDKALTHSARWAPRLAAESHNGSNVPVSEGTVLAFAA